MKTPTLDTLRRHGEWIASEKSPSYSTVTRTLYKYKDDYFTVTEYTRSGQAMVTNVPRSIGGSYENS